MKISNSIPCSFKGYDARRLRGFWMTTSEGQIAQEMKSIGKKEGFKVYLYKNKTWLDSRWAQDVVTIYKDKIFYDPDHKDLADAVSDKFHLKPTEIKAYGNYRRSHIEGGNIFIVKNGDKDEILIGEKELADHTIEEIKSAYGVENVIPLKQMDFHLDLFIRPLDEKRILLADDDMSLYVLKQMLKNVQNYAKNSSDEEHAKVHNTIAGLENLIQCFEKSIGCNKNKYGKQTEETLKANGYDVIKVPGRVYYFGGDLVHSCNFINANVFKNKNDELVYITNSSLADKKDGISKEILKKSGGDLEDYFRRAISPYVKDEHIYFVESEDNHLSKYLLHDLGGGVHCLCSEIPQKKPVFIN